MIEATHIKRSTHKQKQRQRLNELSLREKKKKQIFLKQNVLTCKLDKNNQKISEMSWIFIC